MYIYIEFCISGGTGDIYANVGVGWKNNYSANIGYNFSGAGFAFGNTVNGVTHMATPFYSPLDPMKQVVEREQEIRQEDAQRRSYDKSWSGTINNAANILGPIDFSYNFALDTYHNASKFTKGGGVGLSIFTTGLTGYQVYDQYHEGGFKKINPVDATSLTASLISLSGKGMSSLGFGGQTLPLIGDVAGYVAYPIMIYQLWNNLYKPMDDLRFAPLSIDPETGEKNYGDGFSWDDLK